MRISSQQYACRLGFESISIESDSLLSHILNVMPENALAFIRYPDKLLISLDSGMREALVRNDKSCISKSSFNIHENQKILLFSILNMLYSSLCGTTMSLIPLFFQKYIYEKTKDISPGH